MASIQSFVDVIVTQGARPIETAGFGIPLFVADTVPTAFLNASERTRTYSSVAELVSDGFLVTDPAYLFAEKLFGQVQKPNSIIVGKSIVADANITTTLNAITLETNDYFFLAAEDQSNAAILLVAAFAQANDKMYFTTAPVSTVGAETVTNIAAQLRDLQYDNTQVIVVDDADVAKYPEGAVIGSMAATNPGTSTWFGKTLVGVSAQRFTSTQEANIKANNANHYPMVAGVGFYTDGRQSSGSFGDTVRFSLWLKARIAEAVFGLMKRKSDLGLKVPYSEDGFAMIESIIYGDVIQLGISRGAILTADNGATNPVVSAPKRSEIPANDIANRTLPDVKVEVVFSGAVQKVTIRAYVLL